MPKPINLNLVPTLLEIVTLEPGSAQTGSFSLHLNKSLLKSVTTPTVAAELTFSISASDFFTGSTFRSSTDPTTLSSKCVSRIRSYHTGGSLSLCPTTVPDSLSDFTIAGSRNVSTPIEPPGPTSCTDNPPVFRSAIFVNIGFHIFWFLSSTSYPGLISISSPTFSFPCFSEPPSTPPTIASIFVPGLFMSNDLATNIIGVDFGSLAGVGTVFSIASISKSMFMLCCAEIGIIGAFSYGVPFRKSFICL